jgi:hypothetical protein
MIVRKETKLSNPCIILENEKELDLMLQLCFTALETFDDKEICPFAQLIIDKLS